MNRITRGIASALAISLLGMVAVADAQNQRSFNPGSTRVADGTTGVAAGTVIDNVPLVNWQAAPSIKRRSVSADGQKAATDIVSVFRPLALCRMFDTRNAVAPLGGPIMSANNGRIIAPVGACGIPTSFVAALSISFATQNTTPNAGGFLSFIRTPASPVVANNIVFNTGAEWASSSTAATTASDSSFVAYVAQSTVHLIIDVNGYYQDLDFVDTNTELDFFGTTPGDLFQVTNNGMGRAIRATAFGGGTAIQAESNATALLISSGNVRAAGAGVGTNTFAFTFNVNTAGTASAGTGTGCFAGLSAIHVITHPMLNADPGAIVYITPKFDNTASDGVHDGAAMYRALYLSNTSSCGGGTGQAKWAINDVNGTSMANNLKFNVLVIKP